MHGKAIPIRALLHHAKVDYTEIEIHSTDWPVLKISGNLEVEKLPVYIENGKKFYQVQSILRMLGCKHEYYTVSDADLAYEIDSIVEWSLEWQAHIWKFMAQVQKEVPDEGVIGEFLIMWDIHNNNINKRLERTKNSFIAGTGDITIADFVCGAPYF